MEVIETATFSDWLIGLRDVIARRAIVRRLVKLQATVHFGDVATIDADLGEMRVHVGPSYRLYFTLRDGVVLLRGGTKATQTRDIDAARAAIGVFDYQTLSSDGNHIMTTELRAFDAAHYLTNADDEADLLNDAVADGHPGYIAAALGAVARAHGGVARLATDTGLSRPALHKALSEAGNPTLATVLKVLEALGLQMHIERKTPQLEDA